MKLTSYGKQLVEDALIAKAWTLNNLVEPSQLSIDTVKRFSSGRPVSNPNFVTLCNLLGIDWRIASGTPQPPISGITQPPTNSTNPFMERGMLSNLEDIYGRDRELHQIFEFLHSGASVALVGSAGMGTSSLLWAVERTALEKFPQRQPVLLNMRVILNLEDYYATLADKLGIQAEPPLQFQRQLRQRRALLLLDEVEQLQENWFSDAVRRQLRAWANAGDNSPIRLVVAAHRPLTALFEDSGMDSPFANICHELALQPWDTVTIQGFINSRLQGTGIEFTTEEIEEIIQQSNGIPSQVMVGCYHCYERYRNISP